MCEECGCGEANAHDHDHDHGDHTHTHGHAHPHTHDHEHSHDQTRVLQVQQKVLAWNDQVAARNRAWLEERGVTAVNLISSPGSGKTMLLERTLERLQGKVACAVITGDQQTDNDARRLRDKGAPVKQIETVSACHLDAEHIGRLLEEVVTDGIRLLFIENVGNLVCPSAFDLGESFKIALLSTPEGEDKPVKYPALFSMAPVVVLTKMDLAEHLDWDVSKCREYLRRIRPGVFVFELSAKTGDGMDAWVEYLEKLVG
jgi:hydrogenase nickel incorporation protein HypB